MPKRIRFRKSDEVGLDWPPYSQIILEVSPQVTLLIVGGGGGTSKSGVGNGMELYSFVDGRLYRVQTVSMGDCPMWMQSGLFLKDPMGFYVLRSSCEISCCRLDAPLVDGEIDWKVEWLKSYTVPMNSNCKSNYYIMCADVDDNDRLVVGMSNGAVFLFEKDTIRSVQQHDVCVNAVCWLWSRQFVSASQKGCLLWRGEDDSSPIMVEFLNWIYSVIFGFILSTF
ncbi:hypothetical protein ACOME3_002022 [Neoechinorhynchus agilis]